VKARKRALVKSAARKPIAVALGVDFQCERARGEFRRERRKRGALFFWGGSAEDEEASGRPPALVPIGS
jgi:hypothetical protein